MDKSFSNWYMAKDGKYAVAFCRKAVEYIASIHGGRKQELMSRLMVSGLLLSPHFQKDFNDFLKYYFEGEASRGESLEVMEKEKMYLKSVYNSLDLNSDIL